MADAAEPLFAADRAELQASLRLGSLIDQDSAAPIFNDCVLRARMQMIQAMDPPMITRLQAIPSTSAPTTRNDVARMQAEQLEVILVKYHIYGELPTQTIDNSGDSNDWYGKEAPLRLTRPETRREERMRLQVEAESLLSALCAWYSSTCAPRIANSTMVAMWFGNEDPPPQLGIFA